MAAQKTSSELQSESYKGLYSHQPSFNIFLERTMCEALDDHEGSISIGGRLITDEGIVIIAEEEEEADVLLTVTRQPPQGAKWR